MIGEPELSQPSIDATPGTQTGWVFWITGLSGSGKTTIGRLLFQQLRARHVNSVFLDGDSLRELFGNDLGYSEEDRRRCAERYCRLSQALANQGLHVVVATICMFHECRRWSRQHIPNYYEIYLRAPLSVLAQRDDKQIYQDAFARPGRQVMGVDLPFEEPSNPDLLIDNDGSRTPRTIADSIWSRVSTRL